MGTVTGIILGVVAAAIIGVGLYITRSTPSGSDGNPRGTSAPDNKIREDPTELDR